jgi:hypothetical protein
MAVVLRLKKFSSWGAGFAKAKYFVAMPLNLKPNFFAGPFLNFFKNWPLDFLDAATGDADKMVMVRALKMDLKSRWAICSCDAAQKMRLFQHFEGSKHRGLSHPMLLKGGINLILSEMFFSVEKIV